MYERTGIFFFSFYALFLSVFLSLFHFNVDLLRIREYVLKYRPVAVQPMQRHRIVNFINQLSRFMAQASEIALRILLVAKGTPNWKFLN